MTRLAGHGDRVRADFRSGLALDQIRKVLFVYFSLSVIEGMLKLDHQACAALG